MIDCWRIISSASRLSAHLYVIGIAHAMKVRILSDSGLQKAGKDRTSEIQKRKKWSLAAYDYDETDLSKYDLVINLEQIDPVEAVKTIAGAAAYRQFQVMTYSMKCLSDLALAAKVGGILLQSMADVKVQARDGSVVVLTKARNRQKRKKIKTIKELAGTAGGVRYVEVHVVKNVSGRDFPELFLKSMNPYASIGPHYNSYENISRIGLLRRTGNEKIIGSPVAG